MRLNQPQLAIFCLGTMMDYFYIKERGPVFEALADVLENYHGPGRLPSDCERTSESRKPQTLLVDTLIHLQISHFALFCTAILRLICAY